MFHHHLRDWIGRATEGYDADEARRAGGRALFDHLACLTAGRRVAPAVVGDAGAAIVLDRDDVHWPSVTHPGSIVWTVVRASGVEDERRWRAAHAGYEVTCRLGAALGPEHRRFWHATTTAGTVGGAVAAAIARDTDPVAAAGHAIAVAGGSILPVLQRSPARLLQRDHAVAAALRCAELADVLAPVEDGLENERGMFAAMGGSMEQLLAPAGRSALAEVAFRRHATSGFAQAVVEAAAELAPVGPDADVAAEVPEATLALAGVADPRDPAEAWWSCRHAIAVTLLGRDLEDAGTVDDPRVAALRSRIALTAGPASRVTVDGRSAERDVAEPLDNLALIAKWGRLNPGVPAPVELLT